MKCPHCQVSIPDAFTTIEIGKDTDGDWDIMKRYCHECHRLILFLRRSEVIGSEVAGLPVFRRNELLIRPKSVARDPIPAEIPSKYSEDYLEACLILSDSPKASAALSRRCLQLILRDKAGVKAGNLSSEIQQVLDSGRLPSLICESIDAIRNIGNFAVHPIKSNSTGEILPVEPGEAEWNLDVIEMLFDYYFVQPERIKAKRAALDTKLKDAGKPSMK